MGKKINCDICEANDKKVKAVWFHTRKYTEAFCDECYKSVTKFYSEFKKKCE